MRFTKMHGLGNDYLYINCFEEQVSDPVSLSVAMSDRHTGVGADGIILVLPSDRADFRMRMFNADGSEAETCGNGIRCFAKYVHDRKMTPKGDRLSIETGAGLTEVELQTQNGEVHSVRVNMGRPRFLRREIPLDGPPDSKCIEEEIQVDGKGFEVTCLSVGNPHAVIFVERVDEVPLTDLGPQIEKQPLFPNRVNVEFVEVQDRENLKMRVWERGSGITLACGTGACASAVAAMVTGRAERRVKVHLALGALEIEWAEDETIYMTGPAAEVFSGEWPE